ncbi:aKG-HExxH-type peptide beta-hydroxylase [Actinoplanes sp. CA-051413]|uniref:aKG-HExxH-type peptide beta-hydroxylase n=1 Tax=Actinoplanes sp. CA-051413 TaxID=3239899 RepID=UPI003D9714CF
MHHAPWRDNPRPLGGLMHGVYAFFGFAGLWRTSGRQKTRRSGRSLSRTAR